ncbi:MAG: hypothetical protein V4591_02350, partial [Bdellovibrionota bacterium]
MESIVAILNKVKKICIIMAFLFLFLSCDGNSGFKKLQKTPLSHVENPDKLFVKTSSNKSITVFSISSSQDGSNARVGAITGSLITIAMPFGSDTTSLFAIFDTTGASVVVGGTKQISGKTKNDFTNPIVYTVTAEDASTQTYVVQVTVAQNSDNTISSFALSTTLGGSAIQGSIVGQSIAVTMPFGTDLSSLYSVITYAGASIRVHETAQNANSVNDFSQPVVYTVVAANSSLRVYTVTVAIAPASVAANMISFSFLNVPATGIIAGTSISVVVPYGTVVSSLIADFQLSPYASVAIGLVPQVSNQTVNDFTTPVSYSVTAQDGITVQSYTVSVTVVPPSVANDIVSFSLPSISVTGSINGSVISLGVPNGTDLSSLAAIFQTSANATVAVNGVPQISGQSVQDYTAPVSYDVTAQDGMTTQTYT